MAHPKMDPETFWAKVEKTDSCWLYRGSLMYKGYGQIQVDGKNRRAHRYAYELHYGVDPGKSQVLHTCNVRHCVRKEHLYLGGHQDNINKKIEQGRQKRGEEVANHKLTDDDVRKMHILYETMKQRQIAKKFGIKQGTVQRILCGKSWSHIYAEMHPKRKKRRVKKRFKSGVYKGMNLDSSYELAYVLYCHDHGIKIERNTQKFPYIYRKREYRWIPDFIVNGDYVEIKGRETSRTFAKYKYFPHPLTILRRNDLKEVFTFVIEKYGQDYTRLYE